MKLYCGVESHLQGGRKMAKIRKFSREFKLKVIRELEAQKPLAEVSRSYQVHPATIVRWRREY
ncbi:MAG: hypothetical protein DRQ02_09860 [Candidatus Latescibacterota bacterium]|nr:MAG: hypothetical protein DRQ02_09860 [Candidatus Latescibacterota bacterium]RKY73395.1 MAG: hypothetical protein DRQ24_02330 [Candidatus Latescibacterota bacterium]